MTKIISNYDCESLDEFWNCISPIGNIFGSPISKFIYRGQSNSDWSLSPQVYRKDIIEKYQVGMIGSSTDHIDQTFFEWRLLESFVHHCDLRGLSIPGDSMDFREYFSLPNIMIINGIGNQSWPQNPVLPLMAMAQHHGVPTRLLDWSSNAMIACYFAAIGAVNDEHPKKDKKIAVFGFTFNPHRKDAGYRYIHVPGSTSPNLSAQGGSFVLVYNNGYRGEEFSIGTSLEPSLTHTDSLIKITLPIQLAGELLMRCHKFGVSAASVFPGYDGVAKAVMERNLASSFLERLK